MHATRHGTESRGSRRRGRRGLGAVALVCALIGLALGPRFAWAAGDTASASPIYVLSIWTDDSDDQADALTQALRSQLKAAPGWSLALASQSFETLAIALRCPPKPDAACLERIADQLRADHYVWGTMAKRGHEVTADIHLWGRGKAVIDATVTYADNLTDPNQPELREIAAHLFDKLTGTASMGTLIVRAGDAGGLVVVDGQARDTLHGGVARIIVDAGQHTVALRIPGYHTPAQTALVVPNAEREVDFQLTSIETQPAPGGIAPSENGGGIRARGIVGYSAIVAGAGLLVAASIEAANWFSDRNASDSDRQNVPRTVTDVCSEPVNAAAVDACQRSKSARTVSTLGWIFAGVGVAAAGTGIWLVVSDVADSSSRTTGTIDTRPRATRRRDFEVIPAFGFRSGSLDFRVSF